MTGLSFDGRRFVVTGSSSGIGRALAGRLLDDGAEVIGLDRTAATLPLTEHLAADLADPASIDAAVARLGGEFDGLANVAGVPGTASPETVIAVNVLGMRHLTAAMLPRIRRGGAVVVVSSTAGFGWAQRLPAIQGLLATASFTEGLEWFRANPQEGNAYNFSKEVATVFTLAQALAMLPTGVRINAVLPGPVETPILADFEDTMGKENLDLVREIVGGRHATAEEIGDVCAFLLSTDSRWINGHPIVVDGGFTSALLSGAIQPAALRVLPA